VSFSPSRRIAAVPPSPTVAIKAQATALAEAGRDIINLSTGEPDGLPPLAAVEAAKASLVTGEHKYTPVAGLPALREAVASFYRDRWSVPCTPANTIITHGGKQALMNVALSAFDPGDRVIVLAPAWVTYIPQLMIAGVEPIVVPCSAEDGFQPDPDRIRDAIDERTRGIIINSPNNPTGAVIPMERLRAIAALAEAHDLLIIADEIYDELYYTKQAPQCIAGLGADVAARTVIINAISKTFAMTGWRVGWMVAPEGIIAAAAVVQGHATSGVSAVAQRAALGALSVDRSFLAPIRRGLERRRDVLADALDDIDGVTVAVRPGGAFYLFPRVDSLFGRATPDGKVLTSAADVASWFLHEAGVAAVPGEGFGEPRCIRLAYPMRSELLREAGQRLKAAAAKLK
jgi:aspartate aminotransferase